MGLLALDMFGTLLDMSRTPRDEIRSYLQQCIDPVWAPLALPHSWQELQTFPDVQKGIERLRRTFVVVTLSNAPRDLTERVLAANGVKVDGITALEEIRRYKPHPECYLHCCATFGVRPPGAMMITANPTFGPYPFGDLEIAGAIGMKSQLIRCDGYPQTLVELAEQLGC